MVPSLITFDVLHAQVDSLGVTLDVILILSFEAAILALVYHPMWWQILKALFTLATFSLIQLRKR